MRFPQSIRRVADPVVERIPVPIMGGVNRGLWWNLASAGSGYATGRRAAHQMRCLGALMRPGDVFWDVGAHVGYVTLCASRRVGPSGAVHAFEPSARNRRLLARHVAWNHLANVVIHPFALGNADGETTFGGTETSKMQRLGGGTERVTVRTADGLIAAGTVPAPTLVKVDVEGAEADLVRGAAALIRRDVRLVIAMHGREVYQECVALLGAAGNALIESRELAASRAGTWNGDPDMYAAGPRCAGADRWAAALAAEGF